MAYVYGVCVRHVNTACEYGVSVRRVNTACEYLFLEGQRTVCDWKQLGET